MRAYFRESCEKPSRGCKNSKYLVILSQIFQYFLFWYVVNPYVWILAKIYKCWKITDFVLLVGKESDLDAEIYFTSMTRHFHYFSPLLYDEKIQPDSKAHVDFSFDWNSFSSAVRAVRNWVKDYWLLLGSAKILSTSLLIAELCFVWVLSKIELKLRAWKM